MPTAKHAGPSPSADAAYENAHRLARALVERVGALLQDLPAPGVEEHPVHWGHVGDVGHVNALLSQAVAFLERGP